MKRRCTAPMGAALTDLSKNQARVSVDHSDINNQVIYSNYLLSCVCRSDEVLISLATKTVNYPDKDYDMIIV